ncbi:MAG: LPS assembly lipoprotein LptE, partial [Acidobacteriota bacterium]
AVAKVAETEQDKNVSNQVKQGTGARIGQERGADAILAGDIVTYSAEVGEKKSSGVIKSKTVTTYTAVVTINYRLVDAETTEIIATGEAKGLAERTDEDKTTDKIIWQSKSSETKTNFEQVLLAEATTKCVDDLAKQFSVKMAGARRVVWPVETTVALAEGNRMMISAGEGDGVNLGEVFQIFHVRKVILDPVTKEPIDTDKEPLGTMTITEVGKKSSTGVYSGPATTAGKDTLAIKKLAQN